MATENEKKLIFKDKCLMRQSLKSENVIRSIGILQWFIETNEEFYRRIRLEIYEEKGSYRHVWSYCEKSKMEGSTEKRQETEFTIDMRNQDIKEPFPDKTVEEKIGIKNQIKEIKNDIDKLKEYPAVFKIRHFLKDSDYEVIIDEFTPIGTYHYDSIDHLIELEARASQNEVSIDEALYGTPVKKKDLLDLKESNKSGLYNNNIIAEKAYKRNGKKSAETKQAIEFIENRLMGDVSVVVLQGNSAKANYKSYKVKEIKELLEIVKQKDAELSTAELDSLKLMKEKGYKMEKVFFFVFPDREDEKPAEYYYQEKKQPEVFPLLKELTQRDVGISKDNIKSVPIDYCAKYPEQYIDTFEKVWNAIDTIIEKEANEVLIDVTPGQKYPGIIIAMYCMFKQKPFFYKQKDFNQLLKFPPVPVTWDFVKIDGFSPFFSLAEDNMAYSDFNNLPQAFKNMFDFSPNSGNSLTSLLPFKQIQKKYKDARQLPFGYGEELLHYIERTDQKEYLTKKIRNTWALQWIGDQIPETVEHSQRHSKRLMEFAFNLINTIGSKTFFSGIKKEWQQEFLFLLIVAMNVHDLGHTNSVWHFGDDKNNKKMSLDGLPGVVRDLHNELTVQMLDEMKRADEFNLLEGLEEVVSEPEKMKSAVKIVCKYHRGYLPVEGKYDGKKQFVPLFNIDTTSLTEIVEEEFEEEKWQKITKIAAQWLQFIDGTDVQADRTQMEEYSKIRLQRTRMESQNLAKELLENDEDYLDYLAVKKQVLDSLKLLKPKKMSFKMKKRLESLGKDLETTIYNELKRIIDHEIGKKYYKVPYKLKNLARFAFKTRQFPHFDKHASVLMVYPGFFKEKSQDKNEKGKLYIHYVIKENKEEVFPLINDEVMKEFDAAGIANIDKDKGIQHLKVDKETKGGK